MIIGIGGISRSGKTTLAQKLALLFTQPVTTVHLDDYIRQDLSRKVHGMIDREHPSTIDFKRARSEVLSKAKRFPIVIVEGFLVNGNSLLTSIIDYYIHIILSKETFEIRRKQHYNEPAWYIEHVWNSYKRFGENIGIEKYKIVDGENSIDLQSLFVFLNTDKGK